MFTRIIITFLIVSLALPVAALTRPAESSHPSWTATSAVAKGKNHKNHKHKRHRKEKQHNEQQQPKTDPLTVRQTVTQTFTSIQPITIPNGAPAADKGPANPYPSTIDVGGFTNGTITDVNLVFNDLTHTHHDDLDILLSKDGGRPALVMSDVGDSSSVPDIDLTLDDEATASMPGGNLTDLTSGTYRPTNVDRFADTGADVFAAPAPAPDGNVALSVFDGADPNGTWQLWVMDNNGGDYGDLGGWALQITAEVDVVVAQGQHLKGFQEKQNRDRRISASDRT